MSSPSGRWACVAWITIAHYFVVEQVVAAQWALPYSWRENFISDLGATSCGPYGDRAVCSPAHLWMNVSFALVGLAVVAGAVLLRRAAPALLSPVALGLYVAAGVGSALVAAFPENTVSVVHVLGASAFFVGASLGHVLLGLQLRERAPSYGLVLAFVGAVGLLATGLVATGEDLGLGAGLVERVVVDGADLGFIATGVVLLVRSAGSLTAGQPG